jgi:alpha-amylase
MTKFHRLLTFLLLGVGLAGCQAGAAPTPAPTATPVQVTRVAPVTGLPAGTGGAPWWNDTVFYEVFVRSFSDSNGDGIGDFNGLMAKLDYLNDGNPATTTDLGVTALWLMPIHPSPTYHGYDVTDYYNVNPQYGTLDDFKRLLAEAHKRGIRIILDLVLNHTSAQHPWFGAAQDPQSTYRDWYLWSSTDPGEAGPWGEQVWFETGSGYYYAVFDKSMPDLNYTNPAVTAKMDDIVRFWLKDVGVDGFRVDAAKHLIEEGAIQENSDLTHIWYQRFRPFYKGLNPLALTVGEVQANSALVAKYLRGDELDLAFDFDLAAAFIVSARVGTTDAVRRVLSADLATFKPGQFATFIANHDQNRVLSQLAGKPEKGRGAATMLLTAPGVPFIYYGEELGLLGQKPDEQLRAPMPWSGEKNGAFTTGTPWEPLQPDFAAGKNVAAETADPESLLAHYRALIGLRNDHAALRVGDAAFVDASKPAVYALLRSGAGEQLLVVANLSGETVSGYMLTLAAGPLAAGGRYRAVPLMGTGPCAELNVNVQGGFEAYTPLPALAPFSSLILQLQN